MGRGDKRTTKGKIFKGSFGKKRPKATLWKKKPATATATATTPAPAKAAPATP